MEHLFNVALLRFCARNERLLWVLKITVSAQFEFLEFSKKGARSFSKMGAHSRAKSDGTVEKPLAVQ